MFLGVLLNNILLIAINRLKKYSTILTILSQLELLMNEGFKKLQTESREKMSNTRFHCIFVARPSTHTG